MAHHMSGAPLVSFPSIALFLVVEDLGRSFDPASQEDPDLSVELIDGVFITADYPGLIPASQVTEIEVPVPRIGARPLVFSVS